MIKSTAFTLTESLVDEGSLIFDHKPYLIDIQSVGTQTRISNKDFIVKCYSTSARDNGELFSQLFTPKQGTLPNIQTRMTILNRARVKNAKDKVMKRKKIKPKASDPNASTKESSKDQAETKPSLKPNGIELFKMSTSTAKCKQIFCINTDDQAKKAQK